MDTGTFFEAPVGEVFWRNDRGAVWCLATKVGGFPTPQKAFWLPENAAEKKGPGSKVRRLADELRTFEEIAG